MSSGKRVRIAIIGAGPSGLSVAEKLKKLGYENITIFEKRGRVGGQSHSCLYTEGTNEVIYEMGSLMPYGFRRLHQLIKENGLHLGKKNLGFTSTPSKPFYEKVYSPSQHKVIYDFSKYYLGISTKNIKLKLMHDIFKFLKILFKYRALRNPDLISLSEERAKELAKPVDQWIDEQKFYILDVPLKTIFPFVTCIHDSKTINVIPALLLLRFMYLTLRYPVRLVNGSMLFVKEGYQTLWKKVAEKNNVILRAKIQKIIRSKNKISIETLEGTQNKILEFDKLIISCTPKEFMSILDVRPEEKIIFDKMLYNRAVRVAFISQNIPHEAGYLFTDPLLIENNMTKSSIYFGYYPEGQLDDKQWIYSGYISCEENFDLKKMDIYQKTINDFFQNEFNSSIQKWINIEYWDVYVPFFKSEDIIKGYYQKVEDLQGKNNTYYIGSVACGGTHGVIVDYAEMSIEKFFKCV